MGFDVEGFQAASFSFREKDIPVPALKKFFGKDEKPVFKIRGLTGEEMFRVRAAVSRAQNIEELVNQIAAGNIKEKVAAAVEAMGLGDGLPDDFVMRLNILKLGSVDPDLDFEDCKKVADKFPTMFSKLTDEIQVLTGKGQLGESQPSGATRKSK
jgi:hypothetical protein